MLYKENFIICAPLELFDSPPWDIDTSILIDCKHCKKKMWFSEKKKKYKNYYDEKMIKYEICCFICSAYLIGLNKKYVYSEEFKMKLIKIIEKNDKK